MFVQADVNTFKDLVQKLTGLTGDTENLHGRLSSKPSLIHCGASTAPRRPPFKLQEPKQHITRNLKVKRGLTTTLRSTLTPSQCCSTGQVRRCISLSASPMTPLLSSGSMFYSSSGNVSPLSPLVPISEEEKPVTEKGFYLHPSPLNTPRGSQSPPPKLLTLFPPSLPCQEYKRE